MNFSTNCVLFHLGVLDNAPPVMAHEADAAVEVLGRDVAQHLPQHLHWEVVYAALGLQQVLASAYEPIVSIGKGLHLLFLVGLTAALPLVEGVGLGKGISALCTLSQFIALVCVQVPPLDLRWETKAHKIQWCQHNTS